MRLKKLVKGKSIIAGFLATAICISLCGCGEKQEDFAGYGNIEAGESAGSSSEAVADQSQDSEATEDSTNEIIVVNQAGDTGTLKNIEWNDTGLKVQGIDITPSIINSTTVYMDNPKIYEGRMATDFKDSEESIVNAVFGGTGKKLESISYKDATSYITFLYKYRLLTLQFKENIDFTEKDFKENSREHGTAINSTFQDTYKWIDNDKYSIHMYEGTYNNCKFGLLLAYNYETKTRYIFFDPIAIDEYFPGCQYKTMNISSGYDSVGTVQEVDNNCEYTTDEVRGMAAEILKSFGIDDAASDLSNNYSMFSMATWPLGCWATAGIYSGKPMGTFTGDVEEIMCNLTFSDADCYTTATNDGKTVPSAGYSRIAEQYYDLPEGTDFDEYLNNHLNQTTEGINYTTDGYALFLNSAFSDIDLYNSGVVKITSRGIYGVDLVQHVQIDSVTDNVVLMDFEEIKKCTIRELDKNLDMEKMKNPKSLSIPEVNLSIGKVENEGADKGSCTFVPCWDIMVCGPDMTAKISINAIDGTMADLYYYDYSFE